jgi:hypothetical protein
VPRANCGSIGSRTPAGDALPLLREGRPFSCGEVGATLTARHPLPRRNTWIGATNGTKAKERSKEGRATKEGCRQAPAQNSRRYQLRSPTQKIETSLTVPDLLDELHDLDFDVAKSMRYHHCRRRYWDTWNRANKIAGVLSGSAVVVGIIGDIHWLTVLSGLVVALISVLDLVLDFSERAREADGMFRHWSALAQDIAVMSEPTRQLLAQLRQQRLKIEMEEGPPLDLLERRCSRDEALARGLPVNAAWELKKWERRFAQHIFWKPAHR